MYSFKKLGSKMVPFGPTSCRWIKIWFILLNPLVAIVKQGGQRNRLFSGHVKIKGVYIIFWIQVSPRGGLPQPFFNNLFFIKIVHFRAFWFNCYMYTKKAKKVFFLFCCPLKGLRGGGQSLANISLKSPFLRSP